MAADADYGARFDAEWVYVCEGWWHPNVKSGQVHDHPKEPNRSWQTTMHRQCETVYTRRDTPCPVREPS